MHTFSLGFAGQLESLRGPLSLRRRDPVNQPYVRHCHGCPSMVTILCACLQAGSVSGWQWAEGSPVDVASEPAHLARITAKGPGHIAAAAMSAAGQHVAFAEAGRDSTRLFRLTREARCMQCFPEQDVTAEC